MKKQLLAGTALFAGLTIFAQEPTTVPANEPENAPVVTSLEEGAAVVTTPEGVAVATEEGVTVEEAVEETTGLSSEEAEKIVEDVIESVSATLDDDQEIIKVGTPEVIKEEVEQTVIYSTPVEPAPVEEEEVEEVEEEIYVGSSSLDDIINTQGRITQNVSTEKHFQSVWSRKGYFNISYNSAKLEPKETYNVMYNNGNYVALENMKSDWGVGLQYGRNYGILKHPIANIIMINIDYTPLDFNANHYKKADLKGKLFDSSDDSKGYLELPWNAEKFEFNYGMNVGPSITLAPFTKINGVRGLHFLKFNVYYHIGYHVSLLYFMPKKADDASESTFGNINTVASKLCFGHGLTNAVGFNVSWKAIGVGYEVRWANLDYKSFNTGDFGKTTYKFKAPTGRVYLNIRL